MQMKRGQVTLFIIISLVIIILVIFVLIFQKNLFKTEINDQELNKIKSYLHDCFNSKLNQGVLEISKQSGYNALPKESTEILGEKAAYYLKNNNLLIPNIETIQNQIGSWLNQNSENCLEIPDYSLTHEFCKATVQIQEDTIYSNWQCPVTIKKNSASILLKEFNEETKAPISLVLGTSSKIIQEYKKNYPYLCLDCLDKIASENNVSLIIIPINANNQNSTWFLINSTKTIED